MPDTPFYDELSARRHYNVPDQDTGQDPATTMLPVLGPVGEPVATTAGEQDHSNPWAYAGDPADPPENP